MKQPQPQPVSEDIQRQPPQAEGHDEEAGEGLEPPVPLPPEEKEPRRPDKGGVR